MEIDSVGVRIPPYVLAGSRPDIEQALSQSRADFAAGFDIRTTLCRSKHTLLPIMRAELHGVDVDIFDCCPGVMMVRKPVEWIQASLVSGKTRQWAAEHGKHFHALVQEFEGFPSHIIPVSIAGSHISMARKQRFRTTYAWIYRMRCAAYVDCCPTTFNIFSYDWESPQVYLEFQCDLGCVHPAGKTYGQVRGAARAALLASGLRPHAMVADAMSKALPEAKATGNFTGIPSRHAAKKISSEYLNIGRMDADVEESLNKIRLQFQSHDETSKIFKGLVHDIVCDDDSVSFSLYSEGALSLARSLPFLLV